MVTQTEDNLMVPSMVHYEGESRYTGCQQRRQIEDFELYIAIAFTIRHRIV